MLQRLPRSFRQVALDLLHYNKPTISLKHIQIDLVWDGQFCKRLSSTISEQDFNQNVGEVA